MKKAAVVTLFLIVMVFAQAAGATAGTASRMSANIPFAFHAGGQVIPAGEYTFEMIALGNHSAIGSTLAIYSTDGSVFKYLNAIRGDLRGFGLAYTVTFSRYGGAYFLKEVRNGTVTSSLPKTRAERELALAYARGAGGNGSKPVVVTTSGQE